jgi:hypothetical protein
MGEIDQRLFVHYLTRCATLRDRLFLQYHRLYPFHHIGDRLAGCEKLQ